MNRQEMIDLRDHLETHVRGLQEILRKVQLKLENPAPSEMEPYDDLEEILISAER